jgi:histidinol-phosphatase (PHP family)
MLIDSAVDGHVHTFFCHHAQGAMEEYAQAAVTRGLRKLVFLEHLEIGINYPEPTWLTGEDFQLYLAEGGRLREKFRDRLEIGLGVEVGYNPEREDELVAFLRKHSWERVGISYHFLAVQGRHFNMVSRKQENVETLASLGVEVVVKSYLEGVLRAIAVLPGDVLCHLDAVLRHLPGVAFTAEHRRLIEEILAALARNGMALEVNTSGFPLRQEQYPATAILRQAVRLGVPLVAGSDAHHPREVGRHFEELNELELRIIRD